MKIKIDTIDEREIFGMVSWIATVFFTVYFKEPNIFITMTPICAGIIGLNGIKKYKESGGKK
jgi:hypothetical protein